MGWAKFDDQYTDHPKVVAAGPMAELLDMRAVIHCARYETDGHVSAAQLPKLALGIPAAKKKAQALVEAGRWEPDTEDGWWVHDFLDYHPSREQKEKEREDARERMANARKNKGRSSGDVRPNNGRSSGNPDPAPPVVPNGTRESTSRKRSDRATRLPDGWRPDPEPDLIQALGGQKVADRELAKFCDYWRAKAGKDGRKLDWQATWRNWIRRAGEGSSAAAKPRQDALAASRGEGWR